MYIPQNIRRTVFYFYCFLSVILKTALLSRTECVWLLIVYIFDLNARTNNRIIVEDYFNNRSNLLHRVIDGAELQRMVSDGGSIRGGLHGGGLEGVCGGAGRKEEREKQTKRL